MNEANPAGGVLSNFHAAVFGLSFRYGNGCADSFDRLCHERRLLLQWLLGCIFSVAVWVGYITVFGIAVETGAMMVVYLH